MSNNRSDSAADEERFSEDTIAAPSHENMAARKQEPIWLRTSVRETEQACLVLIETAIEVAFSFLRRAEVETGGGNGEHAAELIAKAVATHDVVLQYAQNMRAEFEVERRKLCLEARRLFEAIGATEDVGRKALVQCVAQIDQ